MRQSAASTEYVWVPVNARENGLDIDPHLLPVTMAFPERDVAPEEFFNAVWDVDSTVSPKAYSAKCLVGPATGGAVALEQGWYDVYVQIDSNPETPVIYSGRLEIY